MPYKKDTHTVDCGEWTDEAGANALAEKIKQFWRDRGKEVKTWLTTVSVPKTGYVNRGLWWNVRSDMINGKPR